MVVMWLLLVEAAQEACLKYKMCTSAQGRGRLPLVEVVRSAELGPQASCIAAMLDIPLREAEVAILR